MSLLKKKKQTVKYIKNREKKVTRAARLVNCALFLSFFFFSLPGSEEKVHAESMVVIESVFQLGNELRFDSVCSNRRKTFQKTQKESKFFSKKMYKMLNNGAFQTFCFCFFCCFLSLLFLFRFSYLFVLLLLFWCYLLMLRFSSLLSLSLLFFVHFVFLLPYLVSLRPRVQREAICCCSPSSSVTATRTDKSTPSQSRSQKSESAKKST